MTPPAELHPESPVFLLLGRWLRLHYRWESRLPELAAILSLPSAAPDADPAILRQQAGAKAEIVQIREESRQWALTLDDALPGLPAGYEDFAEKFRACFAAHEPWIARLAAPDALTPAALAAPLSRAVELTRNLNVEISLRLHQLHPVPQGGGSFAVVCLVGGLICGLILRNFAVFLLGLGFGLLAAYLGDIDPSRRSALKHHRRMEQLRDARE